MPSWPLLLERRRHRLEPPLRRMLLEQPRSRPRRFRVVSPNQRSLRPSVCLIVRLLMLDLPFYLSVSSSSPAGDGLRSLPANRRFTLLFVALSPSKTGREIVILPCPRALA